jgi:hypothetical protein
LSKIRQRWMMVSGDADILMPSLLMR